MNKKTKSILIAVCVIVGIFAAILAVLLIKRTASVKPVNVFSVEAFSTEDYEGGESSTSGEVRCEGFQKITLSETQTVKEVFVKKGDKVKKGARLLSYDTTLSDLDVEKADLALQKLQADLIKAQNELYEINSLVPHYEVLITPKNANVSYKPVATPYFMCGKGTEEDPMYWLIDDTNEFDLDFFKKIMPKGKSEVYVVLVTKEYSAVNGQVLNVFGLLVKSTDISYSFKPFDAALPPEVDNYEEPEEPYYEEYGSDYTEAEIAEMSAEKSTEIKEIENDIKVAELELEKQKKELSQSEELAKEGGVVTVVRDPDEAYISGLPVIEISSGGGYYITGMMSELELGRVAVGNTVTVSTYSSGVTCEGEITSISEFPSSASYEYSDGSTNISYYPFTVFVRDDEALEEGEYAQITYSAADVEDNSFYLENMFIRKENGQSYVYIKNAEGLLEKRFIQTGKGLWGMYTQIKDGLSKEDRIAFPYGKDVKEGAQTVDAGIDELYNW